MKQRKQCTYRIQLTPEPDGGYTMTITALQGGVNSRRNYISHEAGNKDAWVCLCGNTPCGAGFYSCDSKGNQVEPDENWTSNLFVCDDCGLIINYDTLEAVGQSHRAQS